MLEQKVTELKRYFQTSLEDEFKKETEKLQTIALKLDEKLDLVRIQFIKTKRKESDLMHE